MGKGAAGKAISSAIGGLSGGGGGGGGGLTAEQQAALQHSAQQEAMKETAFYTDAGIPFSSGLAYDLGSIGLQTAAQGAAFEQGNQANYLAQQAQQGNQLAQLGTTLGGLNSGNVNTGQSSGFNTGGSLSGGSL